MRAFLLAIVPLLAACGGAPVTLRGSLAEETTATEVWVVGSAERIPIENGAFTLEEVSGDTIELRFATGDDEEPRMLLYKLPDGGEVGLENIWFEQGSAFPLSVALDSDEPVMVNGLRMARSEALPQDLNISATVLATSDDGDALMIRPTDEGMADLDVLITPASVVRTIDGDPVDASTLEFGDTVRVSGIGQGGRVVAAEILVSRRAAVDDDDDSAQLEDDREEVGQSAERAAAAATSPAARPRPQAEREIELASRREEREREREKQQEKARERERGRGRGAEKGKGRD